MCGALRKPLLAGPATILTRESRSYLPVANSHFKNALYAKLSRCAAAARRVFSPDISASSLLVCRPVGDAFIDEVKVDPSGLISLCGWSQAAFNAQTAPSILLDDELVPFLRHFKVRRLDVKQSPAALLQQSGLQVDYLVPESLIGRKFKTLTVRTPAGEPLVFELNTTFLNPNYRMLLDSAEVLSRHQIYGSGPPNLAIDPHVVELARNLRGPLLDFGCGRGALMGELEKLGIEAYGLELEADLIKRSIPPGRSQRITLYDGSFPSPFAAQSFPSVVCSEVLEHIPDYGAAIAEIARLAVETVLFTVPDASGIPLGFRHGSVPWHLLEATHVNFFTQESLQRLLKPYFSRIEFGRVGQRFFNDTPYFVSLAAVCTK